MIEYNERKAIDPELLKRLREQDFSDTEIYFHIGIERTGTKYLQKRIFPTYKGIDFINKNRYKQAKEIILQRKHSRYLVSMELSLNNHFETELEDFLNAFPHARIIMIMRPVDEWLLSHYKRIVKNGYNISFSDLWNTKKQSAYDPEEIRYMKKLQFLESKVKENPLLLLYSELRHSPAIFLKKLADYIGVPFNEAEIDFRPFHRSYSEKQLKALKWVMKFVNISRSRPYKNSFRNRIYRLKVDLIRYVTMYTANVLPDKYFDHKPLVNPDDLVQVRGFYAKDWEEVQEFLRSKEQGAECMEQKATSAPR